MKFTVLFWFEVLTRFSERLLGVHFAARIDGLDHGGFDVVGVEPADEGDADAFGTCLLYTSPSPRDS